MLLRVRNKIQANKFFLVLLAIQLALFLSYFKMPAKINVWPSFMWVLSYSDGIISRGLIGTIITSLFPFISDSTLFYIYMSVYLIVVVYTSYFFGKAIQKGESKMQKTLCWLGVLFCTNPGALACFITPSNIGRFDIFWVLIFFISLSLIINNKALFLIPILTVIGILIHQAYIFLFFPTVFAILLYCAVMKKNMQSRYVKGICIITAVIACSTFLFVQLAPDSLPYTIDEFFMVLSTRTDAELAINAIGMEFYKFPNAFPAFGHFLQLFFIVLLLFPLWLLLYKLWSKIISSANKNKWIYVFQVLPLIAVLPMFVLMIDWGRNLCPIVICLITSIITLYRLDDQPTINTLKWLKDEIEEKWLYFLFLLIYLSIAGRFTTEGMIDGVARMPVDYILHLLNDANITLQDIFPWYQRLFWSQP